MVEDNEQFGSRIEARWDKVFNVSKKNKIHEIEILDANEKDSGVYQFSLDEIRSNKIYTTVDGKCIHLL